MKKIISFSLYGSDPRYIDGMLENIILRPEIYPDWTIRVYVDQTVPEDFINLLDLMDCEVVKKTSTKKDQHLRMFWRFEPLKDKTIDAVICRDADSRISYRESNAVNEWLTSRNKESFHIIRDNPQHNVPILGGTWGATKDFIKDYADKYDKELEDHLKRLNAVEIFHQRGMYFNSDQLFLWRYIWPKVQHNHMAHIKPGHKQLIFNNYDVYLPELPDDSPDYVGAAVGGKTFHMGFDKMKELKYNKE